MGKVSTFCQRKSSVSSLPPPPFSAGVHFIFVPMEAQDKRKQQLWWHFSGFFTFMKPQCPGSEGTTCKTTCYEHGIPMFIKYYFRNLGMRDEKADKSTRLLSLKQNWFSFFPLHCVFTKSMVLSPSEQTYFIINRIQCWGQARSEWNGQTYHNYSEKAVYGGNARNAWGQRDRNSLSQGTNY